MSSIAWLSIVTSDRAIDDVRVGKRHRAVSRVARLSVLIFDRQFLTERKRFDRVVRYALGPMPYALCPMHVRYLMLLRKAIARRVRTPVFPAGYETQL